MLFQLFLHVDHAFFAVLIWMSLTHMFSECQLYDWDYTDDIDTATGFQIQSFTDFPHSYGSDVDFDDQLVIDNPSKRRSADLGSPGAERISLDEAWQRLERLKGLYAELLQLPALMNRRMQVGSQKPRMPSEHILQPHQPTFGLVSEKRGSDRHSSDKRSFSYMSAVPVCPSRTEWRLLHVARDMNDTQVEVFQPTNGSQGHQWFYVTTCDNNHAEMSLTDCPSCCRGINRARYHSRCMTRKSFVMALVRRPHEQQYDWNWIQVDSSCTCSISRV